MSISILSPRFSFVQFSAVEEVVGCGFPSMGISFPVLEDSDIAFQFKLVTTTKAEADALCDLPNSHIEVGIVKQCADNFLMIFPTKTVRYRVNDNTLLYNWKNGLPGFTAVIGNGDCFHIKIRVNGTDTFCSNSFTRIIDDCYTAVLDYTNEDDAFDFDYCGGTQVGSTTDQSCDPTIIQFTGRSTLSIPYTTSLQDKYGPIPTIQVWINDGTGNLVDMGIRASFDTFPPTLINFDFGGLSDGVIKIS